MDNLSNSFNFLKTITAEDVCNIANEVLEEVSSKVEESKNEYFTQNALIKSISESKTYEDNESNVGNI